MREHDWALQGNSGAHVQGGGQLDLDGCVPVYDSIQVLHATRKLIIRNNFATCAHKTIKLNVSRVQIVHFPNQKCTGCTLNSELYNLYTPEFFCG